tara:strand:- start:11755 stop:11982 length:228 start_codon:yes stop_codon:yes gene_type:complete
MYKLKYKGKGEHSVRQLELIIEQQAEELHLLNSGQMQLLQTDVSSSNYIDESPEPRINIHRFNDNEYDEHGHFLR